MLSDAAGGDRYKALVDLAVDGIILLGQDGSVIEANDQMCRIVGREREILIGRALDASLFTEESLARYPLRFDLLRKGEIVVSERTIRRPDGSTVEVEMRTRMMPDGTFQSITRDVTERKRAEGELKASKDRLSRAELIASVGNWELDLGERSVHLSEGLKRIFGTEEDDLSVDGIEETLLPDQLPALRAAFGSLIRRGGNSDIEFRIRQGGTGRIVDIRSIAEYDAPGGRIFGVLQDVSERKRMEEQVLQSRKMEYIGRFAGGVAHDFNNMLEIILGNVEMALSKEAPSGRLRQSLEAIQRAASRSAELTRQLLAFARKQASFPRVVDLNAAVSSMLKMIPSLIGEDVALEWNPLGRPCMVKIDPSQLDQVLANLCANAREAIAGTGRITVGTGVEEADEVFCEAHPELFPGNYVVLSVADDGCGMSKRTLDRIFEPFFTTKKAGQSVGMGLATAYGIVRQNEGIILAQSKPGAGSTFRIYLREVVESPRQEAAAAAPASVPRGRGESLLVVEDEAPILDLVALMAKGLGYAVMKAASAAEALKLAAGLPSGGIDLLVTDVIMPEMNGPELARKLSVSDGGMKVLFMSGYTADVISTRESPEGELHFLQKPFSLAQFAQAVRSALDGAPPEA